jgi:GMP synthase-like glutamine amidotransferase
MIRNDGPRKPVLVLQHLSADGPAYLGSWLARHAIECEVRNTEAGDAYPEDLSAYAALAILGGEMSANDPLPSLRQAERLVRLAIERELPIVGHCLGGQLMARALGARVVDSPQPEIGWQRMEVADSALARAWFGAPGPTVVFQWHYEAFELPAGAERLASSAACPNQAFALGPHLAMQFHVEVDAEKVGRWSVDEGARFAAVLDRQTVQDGAQMRAGISRLLGAHQALADRVYARWWAAARA